MTQTLINLSTGEWAAVFPPVLKERLAGMLSTQNFSPYPTTEGLIELRTSLSNHYINHLQAPYSPQQFLITAGAKHALTIIFDLFVQPGDEVIIHAPYWLAFEDLAQSRKAHLRILPTYPEQDYQLDLQQLEEMITDKTRMFILVNPTNPAAKVYSQTELAALASLLAKYPQVRILSDEIYEHVNFGEVAHTCMASFTQIADRVIVVHGFSKSFGMSGWRVGYIAASAEDIKACTAYQERHIGGINLFAQHVAWEVWKYYIEEHKYEQLLNPLLTNRDIVASFLSAIPHIRWKKPEGAFYYFVDMRQYLNEAIRDTNSLSKHLSDMAGVQVRPGEQCGAEGFVRISFAVEQSLLSEGLTRLQSGLQELLRLKAKPAY
jgi:aspartate aminotransferase